MPRPRPVLPGRTYLITRRCSERRFFLRPGKATNQAVLYALAQAADHCDIDVYAFVALSNHLHAVIHDKHGRYPEFLHRFHLLCAKLLNAHWGRWESLWAASEQTSVVELVEPDDVFDKIIYTLANPVAAHLVERAHHWPGVTSVQAQLGGRKLTAIRPMWFFADETDMPETVTLRFKRPAAFRHLSHEAWENKLRDALRERERKAAQERKQSGIPIQGRRAVRMQSAFDAPLTHAPRRQMSPRVAAQNKWARIEALQRNHEFLIDYAAALERYQAGDASAAFPAGTYKLYEEGHVFRLAA